MEIISKQKDSSKDKHGSYENHHCDEIGRRSAKITMTTKVRQRLKIMGPILWGFIIVIFIPQAAACPPRCTCNDGTVYCNNQELIETPVGISPNVNVLYLFNNNISRILPRTLQPLKNLKLLDLSGNRISNFALWEGVFSERTKLENLMLQENRISKISRKMFKGLKHLARIYLQKNQISIIEDGAFDNLPALVELKLAHNKLVSFPKLSNTPSLLLLDVSFNRLRTIRDMAFSTVNLEYLKLQSNQLTQLRTSLFDDTSLLTKLDISNNRLTAVPQVIKSFTSLSALNMSLNNVGSIPVDTFKKMTKLKVLDLHNMGLVDLPVGTIPNRVILNVLDITGNEWKCGCGLHWLPEYIGIFRDAFVEPNEIKCAQSSKHPGSEIPNLKVADFGCTPEELKNALNPPGSDTSTPSSSTRTTTRTPWAPNPCDVYRCQNKGTCLLQGNMPRCRCTKDWTGNLCQISLTTPTTTTKPKTRPTTTTKMTTTSRSRFPIRTQKPQLLINRTSITENSVEIILPITRTELEVTIKELGLHGKPIRETIRPASQPHTVKGLEPGKSYNICIHLPLGGRKRYLPSSIKDTDTLCGSVKTKGSNLIKVPVSPTRIQVVPSPGSNTKQEIPHNDKDITQDTKFGPGMDDKLRGDQSDPDSAKTSGFKVIYPAIGAGVGAIIVISIIVIFFVCYRHKKIKKLKGQNNPDYIPGSPMDPSTNEMEMTTVVHHHHHNHYNAGGNEPNATPNAKNCSAKKQSNQQKYNNNNSAPKSVTPQKSHSLSRNSVSSSSNSGTIHSRYTDTPQHYQQQYLPQTPPNHPQYEPMPQTRGTGRNDYIYVPHGNTKPALQMQNNHCVPMGGHHYEPETIDEMQPMITDVNPYPAYAPNEGHIYPDAYQIAHRNEYMPPAGVISSYPQGNIRSAFQPIQGPRKNTVRTPTSETGPITTHVNTAHIMPTSTCHNRNIMGDNILRYQEGVPVV